MKREKDVNFWTFTFGFQIIDSILFITESYLYITKNNNDNINIYHNEPGSTLRDGKRGNRPEAGL